MRKDELWLLSVVQKEKFHNARYDPSSAYFVTPAYLLSLPSFPITKRRMDEIMAGWTATGLYDAERGELTNAGMAVDTNDVSLDYPVYDLPDEDDPEEKDSSKVRFYTSCLLSKHGFMDGDILGDLLFDNDMRLLKYPIEKFILISVVEKFVIPCINNKIEFSRIQTIHNPIRADSVDGVDVDVTTEKSIVIDPEYIDVNVEDILAVAMDVISNQHDIDYIKDYSDFLK